MASNESANGGTSINLVNPVESLEFKETKYKGYFVNRNGIVASVKDNKGRLNYGSPMHILKPNFSTSGYLQIYVSNKSHMKSAFVHRLVIETFRGESDLTVDHIDGNKLNNCLSNLQYMTRADNTRKSSLGRLPWNRIRVIAIVDGVHREFVSIKEFSKCFDIRKQQITKLLSFGIQKQNITSKYFFLELKKSLTTIEIVMESNQNWKSKRK